MDLWEAMFAAPAMAKRLLRELHLLLHDGNIREFLGVPEDLSLVRLSLLRAQRPEEPVPKELRDVERLRRCLRTANFHLLWLALKGLAALMERPQLVSLRPFPLPVPGLGLAARRPPHGPGARCFRRRPTRGGACCRTSWRRCASASPRSRRRPWRSAATSSPSRRRRRPASPPSSWSTWSSLSWTT